MLFEDRLSELKNHIVNQHPKHKDSPLSIESLFDGIVAIYDDCKTFTNADKSGAIPRFIQKYSSIIGNLRSLRLNKDDFTYVRRLARGQFGEVSLVRGKFDNKVYALKTLRKSEMLKQSEIAFFMEEKQILAALNSRWITALFASFQDESCLYLVMDYLPGGDLSNLIMKADDGSIIMDEKLARFYIAETLLALKDLHKMNYVHRDLKPGNILLDGRGHVKLADFGSCIQLDEKNGVTSQVTVGTPDYISPEVLQANEGRGAYGKECDFWSLGITLYEMMVGDPPFYAESLAETYHQIMAHKEYFNIPEDVQLSAEVQDLLKKLICDKQDRYKTVDEIAKHPFFKGVNWDKIHEETAPFQPNIQHDEDVSNFAELDDEEDVASSKNPVIIAKDRQFGGNNLAFIGYTFTRDDNISAIISSSQPQKTVVPVVEKDTAMEAKLLHAEAECEKLKTKLTQETKKITYLESAQSTLEAELNRVKKVLSTEMEQLSTKENQIVQLDKEKKVAQIELKNLLSKFQQASDEKTSLEAQVVQLNASLEQDGRTVGGLKETNRELLEDKTRVESLLEESHKKVTQQTEKISQLVESIAVLNRNKAILELEANNLKQQLEDEKAAKDLLVEQIQDIEARVEKEGMNRSNAEEALSQAESIILELRNDLNNVRAQISSEFKEREQLLRRVEEMETCKLSAEKELQITKIRMEELSSRNLETLNTPHSPSKSGSIASFFSSGKTNELSKQLEAEIEHRKKANIELGQLSIEKVSLENQLRESQAKMSYAEKELKDLKRMLKSHEERVIQDRKTMTLGGTRTLGRPDSQLNGSDFDLAGKAKDGDMKTKLEKKIAELQKQVALNAVEISELTRKLQDEKEARAAVEAKLKEMESSQLQESKLRSAAEVRCTDMQSLNETIARDLHKTRMDLRKLVSVKEKQDKLIADQAKTVAVREMERDELQQKVTTIMRQKTELENESENLKTRLNELLNSHINPEEYTLLADECNRVHKDLLEANMHHEELLGKFKRLTAENEALRQKKDPADSYKINELMKKVPFVGKSMEDDIDSAENSKRTRMNITKMKALEQKLNVEMTKRAAIESELTAIKQTKQILENEIDEIRKQVIQPAMTPLVADRPASAMSMASALFRGSPDNKNSPSKKLRPFLFPENSKYPVMQGWLRLRVAKNSKKTKFDWHKRYAVLRDSKLFIYEKEKDKDSVDKDPLVDLKANIFTVRAVKAKELIHLSSKEVACVYTIQVVSSPHASLVSLDDLTQGTHEGDETSLQKKIAVLDSSIEKEERFFEATEKMVAATTGDVKKRTQGEADECTRRIRLLKAEKSDVEKAIAMVLKASAESPENSLKDGKEPNVQASQVLGEIEKKEALLKGVHNMLQVTENRDTRMALTSQLSVVTKDIEVLRSSLDSLAYSNDTPSGKMQQKLMDQTGMKWYLMAADESDKHRWITGLEIVRTLVKDDTSAPSADIDSLLSGD